MAPGGTEGDTRGGPEGEFGAAKGGGVLDLHSGVSGVFWGSRGVPGVFWGGSRCSPGAPPVLPAAPRPSGSPQAVEAALRAVSSLFPRRLFGDALPPLILRHQLYDIIPDRTAVDRHLVSPGTPGDPRDPQGPPGTLPDPAFPLQNRLRDEGRLRLLHLGLGPDALGVVSLELYRDKVPGGGSGGFGRGRGTPR